ncbi:MAG TPA: sulfurtransferase [Candidatus Limnocylindrales bacterium]
MTSKLGRLGRPLVSVSALAAVIDDPALRVVDCRWYLGRPGEGVLAYEAGHLPGALHLDIDADLTAPSGPGRHPLPDPVVFRRRLEDVGIGDEHTVVAYDDVGGWVAARLWWMLDDLGHEAVAVLDGGIGAWTEAGLPLTTVVPTWPSASLTLREWWGRVVERDGLWASLGSVRLLDARAGARYRGETEPIDAYPGHIPTAMSAPTDANLGPDGRFLNAEERAGRYRALGADGSAGEVIVSCGSGVSATHDALALRIAGLPDARLYPGSYSDWTQQGWPVATGPDPGEPPQPVHPPESGE